MQEFFAMGGYALFVWSAFGFWFACVIFNIVTANRRIRLSLQRATIAAAQHHHRDARKMEHNQ